MLDEILTLINAGSIHSDNQKIIVNAYRIANTDKYIKLIQKLIKTSHEINTNNIIEK